MIRGIIFDVDGVILDSMSIWQDLGKRYIRRHGLVPEEKLSEILFAMSMEQGAEYLAGTYPLHKSPELILSEIGQMIESFYFDEVTIKKGVRDLLSYCQKKEIAMIAATSSMRDHVTRAFLRNDVASYITQILTTSEIGTSKHEAEIYYLSAQALHTMPEETLVLEDSLYALETAKKAGFHVIGVSDPYGEEDQQTLAFEGEAYVNDLSEVIPWIESFGK